MISKFNLWPNTSASCTVSGEVAEFHGDFPGVNAVIAASVRNGLLVIETSIVSQSDGLKISGGVLKPTLKRSGRSPDFFGQVDIPDGESILVSAWRAKKRNGDDYFSCSVKPGVLSSAYEHGHQGDAELSNLPIASNGTPEHLKSARPASPDRTLATILAALAFWNQNKAHAGHVEQGISTDGGRFDALSSEEIERLCDDLNMTGLRDARIAISTRSGKLGAIVSNKPISVAILDQNGEVGSTVMMPGCDGVIDEYQPRFSEAYVAPIVIEKIFSVRCCDVAELK